MLSIIAHAIIKGMAGAVALLAIFFVVISLISGWTFTVNQFFAYWYFIVGLAVGFGIQVGLYSYFKQAVVDGRAQKTTVAISGATSAIAMVSCCAHYFANILPIIGVAGVVSIIGQYQIELFWFGLLFNVAGIVYIARKIVIFRKESLLLISGSNK